MIPRWLTVLMVAGLVLAATVVATVVVDQATTDRPPASCWVTPGRHRAEDVCRR